MKRKLIINKFNKIDYRSSIPEEARNCMLDNIGLLEKAPKHIYYEIEKLYEAYNYYNYYKTHQKDCPQIIIEAFLLHTRNLFDFFYPTQKIKIDDMCVFDFLDNYEEFNNDKTMQENLGFDKININKFLSHITYTRCLYDEMPWPIPYIWVGMIKTIKAFYNALPENYKNWDNFQKLKNLLKNIKENSRPEVFTEKEIYGKTNS